MSEQSQELITLSNVNALDIFVKGESSDLIQKVESYVSSFVVDVSDEQGRANVRAICKRFRRTMNDLEEAGKDINIKLKREIAETDKNRKIVRDALTRIYDEFREPLTEYEEEQKRIEENIALRKNVLENLPNYEGEIPSKAIKQLIGKANIMVRANNWGKEAVRIQSVYRRVFDQLSKQLNEQIKLEVYREQEAARKAQEEQERLQREAEERVRKEQEEERQRLEREAAEQKKRAEEAERLRVEAEERAAREKKEAEARAIQERKEAEERAKRAEEERKAAEEKAKKEAEEAIERAKQAERDRIAAEERKAKEEEQKRIADEQHRDNVQKMAVYNLEQEIGVNKATAIKIVEAIHDNKISNIKITY